MPESVLAQGALEHLCFSLSFLLCATICCFLHAEMQPMGIRLILTAHWSFLQNSEHINHIQEVICQNSKMINILFCTSHATCPCTVPQFCFANCSWILYLGSAYCDRNGRKLLKIKCSGSNELNWADCQLLSSWRRVFTVWICLKWKYFQLLLWKATTESKHFIWIKAELSACCSHVCSLDTMCS